MTTTAAEPGLSIRKKSLFLAVIALLSILMAEAASQLALRVAYSRRLTEAERLNDYDSQLGWVNMKNRRAVDRYGPNNTVTHNALGLRATKEYTAAIPPGRYRIIFLGDSFTYGVEVGDAGTFPAQLESLAPSIEAVNMAVTGYGVDQMYLLYMREGGRLDTNLLVLAFIGDDLRRMKLTAFLTQNPKPRLFLSEDRLTVANVPVPTWGLAARTGWIEEFPNSLASVQIIRSVYDLFVQNYDPLPVAERVFADLNNVAAQRHERFAVVYLPAKTDVASDRQSPAAKQLQDSAARDHIPFFDLTSSFKEALAREGVPLFGKGVHYSEAGYKVIAELLLNELRKAFPDGPR
jgi:lysophospholipase L1-like esterase